MFLGYLFLQMELLCVVDWVAGPSSWLQCDSYTPTLLPDLGGGEGVGHASSLLLDFAVAMWFALMKGVLMDRMQTKAWNEIVWLGLLLPCHC